MASRLWVPSSATLVESIENSSACAADARRLMATEPPLRAARRRAARSGITVNRRRCPYLGLLEKVAPGSSCVGGQNYNVRGPRVGSTPE